jgi:hypothetical protein
MFGFGYFRDLSLMQMAVRSLVATAARAVQAQPISYLVVDITGRDFLTARCRPGYPARLRGASLKCSISRLPRCLMRINAYRPICNSVIKALSDARRQMWAGNFQDQFCTGNWRRPIVRHPSQMLTDTPIANILVGRCRSTFDRHCYGNRMPNCTRRGTIKENEKSHGALCDGADAEFPTPPPTP